MPLRDPNPALCVHLHKALRHCSHHQNPTGTSLSAALWCQCCRKHTADKLLLSECLLSSSRRGNDEPGGNSGNCWVSCRNPRPSGLLLATLCCLVMRNPRHGRVLLCFPTLILLSPSQGSAMGITGCCACRTLPVPESPRQCGHPAQGIQSPGWEGQQNPCYFSLSSLQTLDAMDIMLKAVVLYSSGEVLQDILEVWPVQRVGGGPGTVRFPGGVAHS